MLLSRWGVRVNVYPVDTLGIIVSWHPDVFSLCGNIIAQDWNAPVAVGAKLDAVVYSAGFVVGGGCCFEHTFLGTRLC